jgi:hypothetical protein
MSAETSTGLFSPAAVCRRSIPGLSSKNVRHGFAIGDVGDPAPHEALDRGNGVARVERLLRPAPRSRLRCAVAEDSGRPRAAAGGRVRRAGRPPGRCARSPPTSWSSQGRCRPPAGARAAQLTRRVPTICNSAMSDNWGPETCCWCEVGTTRRKLTPGDATALHLLPASDSLFAGDHRLVEFDQQLLDEHQPPDAIGRLLEIVRSSSNAASSS